MTAFAAGCGDDGNGHGADAATGGPDAAEGADADTSSPPSTYTFPSRFTSGDSVAYSGQVLRNVLIADLKAYIGGLTADVDTNGAPAEGEVVDALNFYYEFDSGAGGDVDILLGLDNATLAQQTYNDIATGKDLIGKIAGMDATNMHRDWSTDFAGWSGANSPHELVQGWFEAIEDLAIARGGATPPTDPFDRPIPEAYISAEGQDYRQLVQKFLLVAVSFSQTTDDYLDEGLDVSNAQDEDAAYSVLEHHWDEGFGYFGAARDYNDYTDEQIADPGYLDSDSSSDIDLSSEYNFPLAGYAAKRDLGSADSAPNDFSKAIFDAFLTGRWIIWNAGDELTADEWSDLEAQRDIIALNWEKVLAANVVHYLNSTLQIMNSADFTDAQSYDFAEHAAQWSEMKAFALGLQFNPRSPMLTDFEQLHTLLGDAPVLPDAGQANIDQYKTDLLDARDLLKAAYGFDDANVGGPNGEGGW